MQISLYKQFKDLPKEEWELLLNEQDFFLSSGCMKILEAEHSEEIQPLYFILKENNTVKGIVYAQLFKINGSKLNEYIKHGLESKSVLKNLQSRVLKRINSQVGFLGNLFLSNEEGFKFAKDFNSNTYLSEIIELIHKHTKAKYILIPEFYKNATQQLGINCKQINVEPDMQLDLNPNWKQFDDYLEDISSKYKKRYRKIISKSAKISKRELSPTELKQAAERMKELFDNVYSKSKFNAARFNTDVFYDLKLIKENVSIYGYFLKDKLVGFQSDISSNDVLYAHFVGIDYKYNKDYELYNLMLYEQIRYAIENKIKCIKFGRTASEFKSTIGAIPHKNIGYVYHPCKSVMLVLSPILNLIKPRSWKQRNPFKTKKPL